MKTCFFVCPIGESGSDIRKKSDALLEHILTPVFSTKGYEVIRADKILQTDIITNTILKYLENSEIVVADVSIPNPNVYYELGYRSALKKPLIQICESGSNLPFDISTVRTFQYNLHDITILDETKQTISKLIVNIETNQSKISNTASDFGHELGTFLATGMVNDLMSNPEDSYKYVELLQNMSKMKKLLDEIE